ncbi:5'(3')-nucleotidase/polyphosphatase [Vibrio vulnificus]|uniref:5'/3'-nucleotidase SurE n=1 Tax=Vibrio vulnificus TaxID=672 RepID=UPI0001F5B9B2|nr:5'/3'-nucleotidase SurE [Vibrio vulnificus]ADV85516.1 5-nucleotidase SurE [Vibrio vulnificus MO6-24/O]EGR0037003.1 5'/3'-nucleotidase SurE [Vibrio vulnificus]EGR0089981.1 5'/3'-nucleotidase SurE [Vibrio vulnificus]EGR0094526.1 5'/3'-nucleotidase SurE [Vibrio vulnificus]EGR7944514.1 5'/3'-nucleotidase SurE [Vibrio vulnificus]
MEDKQAKPLRILLSNDDGVFAEGIRTLASELRTLAEVIIVAPDRNRSGASNSLTLEQPLRVTCVEENMYSVQGTPTDCVHFALNELLKNDLPDLVLSGINHGANLGDDVLYSGTVAAAMEGHFLGVQSIAFSLVGKNHFKTAATIAKRIVEQHLAKPIPTNRLLNINIPDLPLEQLKEIRVTRLGARHHAENMIKQLDPRGHEIYWLGPPGKEQDAGEGTDFHAIEQGYVSITPLQVDLTAHESLRAMDTWLKEK